jgi:hypothetical protein
MSSWDSSLGVVSIWYPALGACAATSFDDENVWNLTASAPASAAARISASAVSIIPLWFTPASAIT